MAAVGDTEFRQQLWGQNLLGSNAPIPAVRPGLSNSRKRTLSRNALELRQMISFHWSLTHDPIVIDHLLTR